MEPRSQDSKLALGLLILRLGIGGYLLTHGVSKLEMLLAGQFEQFGDPIAIGEVPSLVLVVFSELVCALLLMAGLATRFAAAVVVVSMAVAAFVAHGGDPWTMEAAARLFMSGEAEFWGSREPALLYLIPCLALVFTGAGRWSLDAPIASRRRRGRALGRPGASS